MIVLTDKFLLSYYHAIFHCHLSRGFEILGHAMKYWKYKKRHCELYCLWAGWHDHCTLINLFQKIGIADFYSHCVHSSLVYDRTNVSSLTRCLVHYSYNMRSKNDLEIPHFRLGKKKDEDTHGKGGQSFWVWKCPTLNQGIYKSCDQTNLRKNWSVGW